jgi:hypothetical protein
MLWFWFAFSAIFLPIGLISNDFKISELKFDGLLYLLALSVLYGVYSDRASRETSANIHHTITLGEDALIIQASDQERSIIPWNSIANIDDFNIRDKIISTKSSEPDYWTARAVGGIRIITKDNEVHRIYRTLENFKYVREEIILRSHNAKLLRNGFPDSQSFMDI